jgi:hypothetical protein
LNGRGLTYHYRELEPEERFRLAIEAVAREDDRELARLADSVPMYHYSISDPAYMDRVAACREIALTFGLEMGPLATALRILQSTRTIFADRYAADVAREVHEELGVKSGLEKTIAERRTHVGELLAEEEAELRSRAAASYGAFREVCAEMGLAPKVVLRAHIGPLADQLGVDELDGVEPDKEARAGWGKIFRRMWQKAVEQ